MSVRPTAIPTRYGGIVFRSRLEARWAVLFDVLGYPWEYEPEGFEAPGVGRYLPDFRVRYPGRGPSERHYVWLEVKPDLLGHDQAYYRKIARLCPGVLVLDGQPSWGPFYLASELAGAGRVWVRVGELDGFDAMCWASHGERAGWFLTCYKGRLWGDYDIEQWGCANMFSEAISAARSARFD